MSISTAQRSTDWTISINTFFVRRNKDLTISISTVILINIELTSPFTIYKDFELSSKGKARLEKFIVHSLTLISMTIHIKTSLLIFSTIHKPITCQSPGRTNPKLENKSQEPFLISPMIHYSVKLWTNSTKGQTSSPAFNLASRDRNPITAFAYVIYIVQSCLGTFCSSIGPVYWAYPIVYV